MQWIEASNGNVYNTNSIAGVERGTRNARHNVQIVLTGVSATDKGTRILKEFDDEDEREAYFESVKATIGNC